VFDVGFTEILMIGVVALVVIGPERLPDVARTAGSWIGKMQRFVRGVKTDLASELQSGDLQKLIGDQKEQIDELRRMVKSTTRDIESSTTDIVKGAKKTFGDLEKAVSSTESEGAAPRIGSSAPSTSSDGTADLDGSTSGDVAVRDVATAGETPDPAESLAVLPSTPSTPSAPSTPSRAAVHPDDRDSRSDKEI